MSHTRMSHVVHIGTQAQRHFQASTQSKNVSINACSNFTREWKQQDRAMTPSPFRSWDFLFFFKYFRKFVHLRRQLLTSQNQRKIKFSMHKSSWPLKHLHHTATHCTTLQHTATHCNALQHTATHCNTLQHTATHCNTGVLDLVPTLECFWALLQVFPLWHDQSMCVTWPIHVCDLNDSREIFVSYVSHDFVVFTLWLYSFWCVTLLIHMCDMTHSYVWHDLCKCVTRLTHILDLTHSYVSRHCLVRNHIVPWLVHM